MKVFILLSLFIISKSALALTLIAEPSFNIGMGKWKGDWENESYKIKALGDFNQYDFSSNFLFINQYFRYGISYKHQIQSIHLNSIDSTTRLDELSTYSQQNTDFINLVGSFHWSQGQYSILFHKSIYGNASTNNHLWNNTKKDNIASSMFQVELSYKIGPNLRVNFAYSEMTKNKHMIKGLTVNEETYSQMSLGLSFPFQLLSF